MDPATPTANAASQRQWEIDALRGLMLVLMTLTHLPTRFSSPTSQPFGFVSAAEGFVLLSAFMAAKVYGGKQRKGGEDAVTQGFLKRALKIWLVQAALLLLLFTLIALLGLLVDRPDVKNLMSFYLERPLVAFAAGLLLLYNPPLLDILPMYVLFMLLSPIALLHGGRRGWGVILAGSLALWLAAQAGIGTHLYQAVARWAHLPVPVRQTGSFVLLGWQLLWVIGLWMGARAAAGEPLFERIPRWMLHFAWVFAVAALLWRHAVGQTPWPADGALPAALNAAFDKWHLGGLRMVNLFALLVLVLHHGPALAARMPRPRVLETLGRASLPVFVAHLLLVLLVLVFFGGTKPERPWALDLAILAVSFAVLYATALGSSAIDRHSSAVKSAFQARRQRLRLSAGASR